MKKKSSMMAFVAGLIGFGQRDKKRMVQEVTASQGAKARRPRVRSDVSGMNGHRKRQARAAAAMRRVKAKNPVYQRGETVNWRRRSRGCGKYTDIAAKVVGEFKGGVAIRLLSGYGNRMGGDVRVVRHRYLRRVA